MVKQTLHLLHKKQEKMYRPKAAPGPAPAPGILSSTVLRVGKVRTVRTVALLSV